MQTTPETYSDRAGAKDYGREYEVQVSSLLFLRSIKSKDTKHTWLAMNVNECGAFDDLLLYRQTLDGNGITYLIQLKQQTKERVLRRRDFINARKDDFLLKKYANSIREIKTNLDKNDTAKCDVLAHLSRNYDKLVFIIFTNRGTTEGDFLKSVEKNSDKDRRWILYDALNINGTVWQFNYEQLDFQIDEDISTYMDDVYLFSKQIRVKHLNAALENCIKGFVGSLKRDNKFIVEIVKDFIWFMTDWSKGHLGGYYPLTKEKVFKVLLDLMLAPYMVKVELPRSQTNNCDIWNKITTDKQIILVDWDDSDKRCLQYIQQCITSEVVKYCEEPKNKKVWLNSPDVVSKQMMRVISRCKKIGQSEAYEFLRKTDRVPLVIKVETLEEYKDVLVILKAFLGVLQTQVIVINKSQDSINNFGSNIKVLSNFGQLSVDEQKAVLRLNIKLQQRPCVLQDVVNEKMFHCIKVAHIISILCGDFNIGDHFRSLPENFVERTLGKIWLNCKVLQDVMDCHFLIKCVSFYDFKMFLRTNNVRPVLSKYYWKGDGAALDKTGIIIFEQNSDLARIESQIKNGSCHYLILHGQSDLEWVRSFKNAKSVMKFKSESSLVDVTSIRQISDEHCRTRLPVLYLISSQSGMGKSTLMDYIFQNSPSNFWVLRINLLDFVEYYQNSEFLNSDNLEYFAAKMLIKDQSKTDLAWEVFKHHLAQKRVLVLLDGFDEVPIVSQEYVKYMIKTIHELDFSVFVTTRPVLKTQLEEHLQTFALSLTTFTKDDQFNYLTEYFTQVDDAETAQIDDRQNLVHLYVTRLLNSAKLNINNQDQEFTGIPLQTKLLAEVFTEDYKLFLRTKVFVNEHFDFLYLYKHFIEQKLKIACVKFGNTSNDMLNLYKNHASLYALRLLFTKEDLEELNVDFLLQHLIKFIPNLLHLIQRDGIVIVENERVVTFAHRTFAEYLAAEWLYNNVNNADYSTVIRTLIKRIFNSSFGIARNVFDRLLSKNLRLHLEVIGQNRNSVTKLMETSDLYQTDQGGRTFLHLMAAWGVFHPINKVTKPHDPLEKLIQKVPADIINKLSKQTDSVVGYTPLDYALISGALNIADEICVNLDNFGDCITTIPDLELNYFYNVCYKCCYGFLGALLLKYATLLDVARLRATNADSQDGKTELHWAVIQAQKQTVLKLLSEGLDPNIMDDKYKTAIFYAASVVPNDPHEIISALLEKGAKTNIKGCYNHSLLHYCIFYNLPGVFELLLDKGGDINSIDAFGRAPLHWAAIAGKTNFVALLLGKNVNIALKDKMHLTALHCSAKNENVDITELLLNKIDDINIQDSNGNTPLHEAVNNGYCSTLELLLAKGADIEAKNKQNNTVLHCAVSNNNIKVIKLLLSKGADIEAVTVNSRTALFIATFNNNTDVISLLLDHNANINTRTISGKTPLHLAALKNHAESLDLLLSRGADIEAKSKYGNTALNFAIKENNLDAIQILLSHKANIEAKLTFSGTPLHFATKKNYTKAVGILLKNGANTETRNYDEETPLHLATEQNHLKIAEALLDNGARVNAKFHNDKTALHVAAEKNYTDFIAVLLNKGANIEDRDEQDMTALHWAVYKNNKEAVQLLLSLGANIEAQDDSGMTALHWIAYKGRMTLLKLLVSKGADLESRDFRGLTPLHWATLKGHNEIVKVLLTSGAYKEARDYNIKTPLLWGCYNNNVDTIKLFLSEGVDVEQIDSEHGRNALILASINGCCGIVNLLLACGASIGHTDKSGKTGLLHSAILGHTNILQVLLLHGANIEERDVDFERSALIWAAYKGHISCVELLLKQGACQDARDADGMTALDWAATKGHRLCAIALCGAEDTCSDNLAT